MPERAIGIVLTVHIELLPAERGGRTRPIRSGYRPVCVVVDTVGDEVSIGLCELEMTGELPSGQSGDGRLLFGADVSDLVRSLLDVGSCFWLAEGSHRIGCASVLAIG